MFNNKNINIRLPDLHTQISRNELLILKILLNAFRPEHARWRSLLAGAVLLASLSSPLQALPENTQSGDVESNLNLNFSATTPITLSKMMVIGGSEVNSAHRESLEYDLNIEVVSAGSVAMRRGTTSPPIRH